ncbi:MAG: hypothetical protein DHS20C05_10810 [Hyphococcus sp.]|nr:MAG: hypothetical protein DHS20C05_10810 [Marinicaulis sp.]
MRIATILVLLFAISCAPAEEKTSSSFPISPEQDAILLVVDEFFLALGSADIDAFKALHSAKATNVVVLPEGDEAVRYRTIDEAIEGMRAGPFPKIRERYWDPVVLERNGLAVVWTPYSIDIDGARSHCGVDVFNMTKHGPDWKIDSVSFTVEPSACEEFKPGENSAIRPDFSALGAEE